MKVKEFAKLIVNKMEEIKRNQQLTSKSTSASQIIINPLLIEEANQAERALEETLQKILEENISEKSALKTLTDLLETRSVLAKQTHITHFNSLANQYYEMLAQEIDQFTGTTHYRFLVPTATTIYADDGASFIDVKKCLERAQEDKTDSLIHTHPNATNTIELTENEKKRVIHFNINALRYYRSIADKKSLAEQQRAHNRFVNTVVTKNALSQTEEQKSLTTLALAIFPTQEKFLIYLLSFNESKWEDMMKHFSLEYLNKVILNGRELSYLRNDLQAKATDVASYQHNARSDKALLFVYQDIYRKELASRPKDSTYLSRLGWFADKLGFNAVPKTIKDAVSKIAYDLLAKQELQPEQLKEAVTTKINSDPNIIEKDKALYLKALEGGVLSSIIPQSNVFKKV